MVNKSYKKQSLDFKRRETLQVTQEYNDEYEDNSILPVLSVHIPSNSLTKTLNSREKYTRLLTI